MSNWLTYSPTSGHGNATITLSASTLTGLEDRIATLIATGSQEGETLSATTVITQKYLILEEIYFENLTWSTDIPYTGGTATKDNCTYAIFAKYSDGSEEDITNKATVSGFLVVSATTATTRQSVGTLTLTATYEGKTCTGNVTAYQEAPSLSEIFFNNLEWATDIPASGGIADKNNCSYSVYAKYSNNIQVDITSKAEVSGSLQVSPNYVIGRHSAGTLTLTATYEDKTCTGSIEVYQELQQQEISAITFNSLTWATNVAASGGTATKDNCAYQIDLILNNGIVISDITSLCTVSGSIVVEPHYELQSNQDGLLTLQGEYNGFTCYGSVNVYRDALTINDIVNIDLSGLTWNGSDIDCTGGTADYTNCDYDVNLNIVDGSFINITDIANVSGSTWIPFSNIMSRHTGGTLTVTAEFSGFTDSDNVAIWQEAYDYYKDWFTIENTGSTDTSFSVKGLGYYSLYYSYDSGKTWNEGLETASGSIPANSCIKFKSSSDNMSFIGQLDNCIVYGNAMSLVSRYNYRNKYDFSKSERLESLFSGCNITNAENLILQATGTTESCYAHMFYKCTELIKPPKRIANAEAHNKTYEGMFEGCTALTSAPTTSISQLKRYSCTNMFYNCSSLVSADNIQLGEIYQAALESICCCANMFYGCTSLTNAPSILPAKTLTQRCYMQMFEGCTALTTAPELPATTLTAGCYHRMFFGCSNLRYIKCLANTINSPSFETSSWVYGVAPTGTFVKAIGMETWTTGSDGIPRGWTVQDDTSDVSAITFTNLTWVTDVPASGGIANKNNCSYQITAHFNNGTTCDVSSMAIVSGSLDIPASTEGTRHSAGTLSLTATYGALSASSSIEVYQEAYLGITFLDYITFTGTSYINTGIIPDRGTKVEMSGVSIASATSYFPLFGGCDSDNSGDWFRVRTEERASFLNGAVGNKRSSITGITYPISNAIISLNSKELYYDYRIASINATSMNNSKSEIYIHTDNRNGVPTDTRSINMSLSRFKIWKNNVLVADLRAAKSQNNEYGLYDEVSNVFKTNIGGGGITGSA